MCNPSRATQTGSTVAQGEFRPGTRKQPIKYSTLGGDILTHQETCLVGCTTDFVIWPRPRPRSERTTKKKWKPRD